MHPDAYMWIIRGDRAAAEAMERIMGGPDAVHRLNTPDRGDRPAPARVPVTRSAAERRLPGLRRLLPFLAR